MSESSEQRVAGSEHATSDADAQRACARRRLVNFGVWCIVIFNGSLIAIGFLIGLKAGLAAVAGAAFAAGLIVASILKDWREEEEKRRK